MLRVLDTLLFTYKILGYLSMAKHSLRCCYTRLRIDWQMPETSMVHRWCEIPPPALPMRGRSDYFNTFFKHCSLKNVVSVMHLVFQRHWTTWSLDNDAYVSTWERAQFSQRAIDSNALVVCDCLSVIVVWVPHHFVTKTSSCTTRSVTR